MFETLSTGNTATASRTLQGSMADASDVMPILPRQAKTVRDTGLEPRFVTDLVLKAVQSIGKAPLPVEYGFPLKLRVPTKIGFKNPKYIASLFVTNDYPGGWWEDQGYNWFSGS